MKNENYLLIINSIEDYAVFVTDLQGTITTWNSGAANVLGYSEEEIIGKNADIFFIAEDKIKDKPTQELAIAASSGKAVDERYHVKKDGSTFWGSGLVFPLYDESAKHIGYTKVMRDLSERKNAEQAVVEARDYFKNIVDTVREPLIVLSDNFIIDSANRSFYDLFKVNKKDITGESVFHIDEGHWDDPRLKILLDETVKEGESFNDFELRYDSPKTGRRLLLCNARRISGPGSKRMLILLAIEDVTDKRTLEQQRNDFIGIASHELKTPVTSIKAYCEIIQQQLLNAGQEKLAQMAGKMQVQVGKLNTLIGDLLDATKIEVSKLQFKNEIFSFNQVVDEVVEATRAANPNIEIVKENILKEYINGDPTRTSQVLHNLLNNAIKYSPGENKVIVSTSTSSGFITCCVRDFGLGIPKENQERIFERFYRLTGDARETFPGLGLGLYIASEIIQLQGGKMWVESEPGKGSSFYFRLPLNNDHGL